MFSLESLYRGDANEYTNNTIFNMKKKITLNYPKYNNVCSFRIFSYGLKNEFEIAVAAIEVLLYLSLWGQVR